MSFRSTPFLVVRWLFFISIISVLCVLSAAEIPEGKPGCEQPLAQVTSFGKTVRADAPYVPQDGNTYDFSKEFKKRPGIQNDEPQNQQQVQPGNSSGTTQSAAPRAQGGSTQAPAPRGQRRSQGAVAANSTPYSSSYIVPGLFNLSNRIPLGRFFELSKNGKHLLYTQPSHWGGMDLTVLDLDMPLAPRNFNIWSDVKRAISSQDGKVIVLFGDSGEVNVIDASVWQVLSTWKLPPVVSRLIANQEFKDNILTSDLGSLVVPDVGGEIFHIYDLKGKIKRPTAGKYSLPTNGKTVTGVHWGVATSPDSKILFRTAVDQTGAAGIAYLIVEDLASGAILNTNSNKLGPAKNVKLVVDPEQKYVVATGMYDPVTNTDSSVVIEWGTWREIKKFDTKIFLGSVNFAETIQNYVVLSGTTGTLIIDTDTWTSRELPNQVAIAYAGFSSQKSIFYTVDYKQNATFYDVANWNILFVLPNVHVRREHDSVLTSAGADTILTMENDYLISVVDRASLSPMETIWADFHSKKNQIHGGTGWSMSAPNPAAARINGVLVSPQNHIITKSGTNTIEIMKFKP